MAKLRRCSYGLVRLHIGMISKIMGKTNCDDSLVWLWVTVLTMALASGHFLSCSGRHTYCDFSACTKDLWFLLCGSMNTDASHSGGESGWQCFFPSRKASLNIKGCALISVLSNLGGTAVCRGFVCALSERLESRWQTTSDGQYFGTVYAFCLWHNSPWRFLFSYTAQ